MNKVDLVHRIAQPLNNTFLKYIFKFKMLGSQSIDQLFARKLHSLVNITCC